MFHQNIFNVFNHTPCRAATRQNLKKHMDVKHATSTISPSTPRGEEDSVPRAMSPRRYYKPADYSSKIKRFGCQLCTMRFSILINLYKHLHLQHPRSTITRVSIILEYRKLIFTYHLFNLF